jgi:YfiH family protein
VTASPFDLRLFGERSGVVSAGALGRWDRLRSELGFRSVVHARQVHGTDTLLHEHAEGGIRAGFEGDAHLTTLPGVLLTVSVADCVPVYLVAPKRRVVGLLHAGWRGVAAGILPLALEALADRWGVAPGEVHVHLGPAICGHCYEVGPEVHVALGLDEPAGPRPVDLRAHLLGQAARAGVDRASSSVSAWCTRCDSHRFFSHRAGSDGRQVGFLGIRDPATGGVEVSGGEQ